MVDLAIDQSVKFVLIAGDLYDGNWKNFQTGMFFVKQAARLRAAGIPLFLIAGNHDAANKMTRSLPLPDNVTFFSADAPHTVMLEELDVAIHGQSFATSEVLDDLSLAYPAAVRGCLNIGLLHTSADGREDHDPYAPCSIEGLKLKGYDYWALGHIHKREILCQAPWVIFSGNVQGRHIRETGPKGCFVVTVHDDRRLEADFQPLDVLRWELAVVDVHDMHSMDDMAPKVSYELEQIFCAAEGRPLAVRVELRGATNLHRELQAEQEHWMQQIRGLALDAGQGQIWIEKVKLRTIDPARVVASKHVDEAAISELNQLFSEVRASPDLLNDIGFDFDSVIKKLPPELKSRFEMGTHRTQWMTEVLDQANALLLHRLQSGTRY